MPTLLTIDHANNWSWGELLDDYIKRWPQWSVARMLRSPRVDTRLQCPACAEIIDHCVQPLPIDATLSRFFDLVLVQNVDTLPIMADLSNAVCRSAGMIVNDAYPADRYDRYLAQCAGIIATNDALAAMARRVNANTTMIPNGLDLDIFKPQASAPRRLFTVGFAGNIYKAGLQHKGYRLWVDTTARLFGKIQTMKRLTGYNKVPHQAMPAEFYSQIDCLVLPSRSEGCSNVTAEALACGVPVLTTRTGYHGERLRDGVDVLWIERDVDDIIAKIERLMDDDPLRRELAINGRAFAQEHHDIDLIAKQYADFMAITCNLKGK